jgi:hypothetical protein
MPAQIETFRWCQQNEFFHKKVEGSKGETYHVQYGVGIPGPYGANWSCTCKGFEFRGTCKHVKQAESEKCDYGWEAAAGSPITEWPDGKCPKCGSPAVGVKVAV